MKIASVIEYKGDNKTVVWKHPRVNFNSYTQLIVQQSQVALFYLNGEVFDVFTEPGKYTLDTGKIPLLADALINKFMEGDMFSSEVCFINMVEQMDVKWGTSETIGYQDKTLDGNYRFNIGLRGTMSFRIADPKKLVINLVGAEPYLGQAQLINRMMDSIIQQEICDYLLQEMSNKRISIFDLDYYRKDMAKGIQEAIKEQFLYYGIEICGFWILGLLMPDSDPIYQRLLTVRGERAAQTEEIRSKVDLGMLSIDADKILGVNSAKAQGEVEATQLGIDEVNKVKEATINQNIRVINANTEAEEIVKKGMAEQQVRERQGISRQQELAYEVAKAFTENESVGGAANAGVQMASMVGGAGVMAGAGMQVANMVNDVIKPIMNTDYEPINKSQQDSMPMDFLRVEEESDSLVQRKSFEERVTNLKMMKDNGLISDAEFEAERNKMLEEIRGL